MKKVLLAFAALIAFLVAYQFLTLPDVSVLKKENPKVTALMQQRSREAAARGRKARRLQTWVRYENISSYLKSAVLIGEDDAFYRHEGIDYTQIKEAFIKNWEKKSFVRGGSTITQQLAKNLYLSTSKNPLRKLREFFIARDLEDQLSKRRIFEIYLNVIEWGDGIYGVEAASHSYFGKSARDLDAREAVLLAAVIPNPRRMNPSKITPRLRSRAEIILSRMLLYKHITAEEHQRVRAGLAG
ncbi:MAG: monofunctional biosynthetic peptidoglycan transglycosylase [Acidobacteriota bacterium]